jgi:receptor protein-tyrosine kinase
MSKEGDRMHLIERAARRLDQVVIRPAASPRAVDMTDLAPLQAPIDANEVGQAELASGVATTKIAEPTTAQPKTKEAEVATDESGAVIDQAAFRRAGLVDWSDTTARVAQEINIVQTEILRRSIAPNQNSPTSRSKLVMVTSALPGEGKSFTSLNVAVGIARQHNCRVLLIDADGKVGSLAELLGLAGAPGLLNLAADRKLDASRLTVPTCIANLDFLPFGQSTEKPAEGFGETNTASVMNDLVRRFPDRLILLDAPPCLSSSRPHLLAPLVNQVVLVVAAGQTQQSDVEAALGLVQSCSGVSLLLNKVRRWHTHSFGSYAYAA